MLTVPLVRPAVVFLRMCRPCRTADAPGDFSPPGLLADFLTRRAWLRAMLDDRGVANWWHRLPRHTAADLVSDAQAGLNFLVHLP
jgi:hypothetical protein